MSMIERLALCHQQNDQAEINHWQSCLLNNSSPKTLMDRFKNFRYNQRNYLCTIQIINQTIDIYNLILFLYLVLYCKGQHKISKYKCTVQEF